MFLFVVLVGFGEGASIALMLSLRLLIVASASGEISLSFVLLLHVGTMVSSANVTFFLVTLVLGVFDMGSDLEVLILLLETLSFPVLFLTN